MPQAPLAVDESKWANGPPVDVLTIEHNELMRFTRRFNTIPVPSIAIPTPARHANGLPAGVLLWGRPAADSRLLAVAIALEKALATTTSAQGTALYLSALRHR